MSPIPSDPLKNPPFEMTTKDGRKVTLKVEGLVGPEGVEGAVQRGPAPAKPAAEDEAAAPPERDAD